MTMINAQTERDGSALVQVNDGPLHKIKGTNLDDARAKLLTFAEQHAVRSGDAVTMQSSDPDGTFTVLVHPDGRCEQAQPTEPARRVRLAEAPGAGAGPDDAGLLDEVFPTLVPDTAGARRENDTQPATEWLRSATPAVPAHRSAALGPAASAQPKRRAEPPAQVPNRIGERPSFITAGRAIRPAEQGWQGQLNKLGVRLPPGPAEESYRQDVTAVAALARPSYRCRR
ncbi:MAG: hypothetical protein ACRCTR_06240 [Actinomycetota bacterium]